MKVKDLIKMRFDGDVYDNYTEELGFFWCSAKKAWAWTDKPTENKFRLSLDEIRRLHGSEIIKEEQNKKLLQAAI